MAFGFLVFPGVEELDEVRAFDPTYGGTSAVWTCRQRRPVAPNGIARGFHALAFSLNGPQSLGDVWSFDARAGELQR